MIILLPPSETKTAPASTDGASSAVPALDLDALTRPDLTSARSTMLRAAMATAAAPDGGAMLGVPKSAPQLQERMRTITSEPCGPALEVYSGVLFDALGRPPVRADIEVLITSALLGVVDAQRDLIPAYRISAGSTVKRLGKAGTWWKKQLAPLGAQLAESLVIDGRSGAYRSMMPVPGAFMVSPVMERDGKRTVVSHDAKRYRGLVAKALLEAEALPASISEVVDVLRAAFTGRLDVELDGQSLIIVDRFERR